MIKVYTDGACSNNGYENATAGVGVVFVSDKESLKPISKRVKGKQTNNTAELWAVYYALKRLYFHAKPRHAHFYIDNKIALNTLITTRQSGENWDIIEKIYYIRNILVKKGFKITGEWVPRNTCDGNRMADKLAKQGAKMVRK
jgi:ribonuclease HI